MTGPLMPLIMASPGGVVRIVEIRGGGGLTRRLADMGLTPGISMKVINSHRPGPVVIEVRGSRLILGHGVAHKILVTGC